MNKKPLRIIQISDLHLFSDPGEALLGVKTQESLAGVLDLLRTTKEPIDLIILSGDLSQDGSPIAYQRLAEMFNPFNVPVYWVPGNHDDPDKMLEVYPRKTIANDKHIVLKNWQLILLDTHKPNAVEGFLNNKQLSFLKKCLTENPKQKAIIIFHHQPLPVGCKWLDRLGLTNAADFWNTVKSFPQVHTVLFGHVHQDFQKEVNGITCYAVPSTCIQFKGKQDTFELANLPPGYRWVHLFEDGHLETGVKRTENYIGVFELNAKGY